MRYALPVSKQSARWKRTHRPGPAFPMGSKRQAASARGFAIMGLNKGTLSLTEARSVVKATETMGLDPKKIVKGPKGRWTTEPTRRRSKMARKRKKTTTRRRVRRVRRNPRRSTRKGAIRRTSRRAYVGTKQARRARARRRSNPSMFRTPAARFGLAAVAGAAAAAALDANAEAEGFAARLRIPLGGAEPLSAGITAALLTVGITRVFKFKASTRSTALAAAIGMLAPSAIAAGRRLGSGTWASTMGSNQLEFRRSALSAPRVPRGPRFNSASAFITDLIPA